MLKRLLSIMMLAVMLATNVGQVVIYASEPIEEEVIEEYREGGEDEVLDDDLDEDKEVISENEDKGETVVDEIKETEPEIHEDEDNEIIELGESVETKEDTTESEEDMAEPEDEVELVKTVLTKTVNGFVITAEGEMPKNATLSVRYLTADELNLVDEKINDTLYDFESYRSYVGFDIDILSDGMKWQPVDFDRTVNITIESEKIENIKEEVSEEFEAFDPDRVEMYAPEITDVCYRVDNIEESVTELSLNEESENTVAIETEHFTTFTVGGRSYDTSTATRSFSAGSSVTAYWYSSQGVLAFIGSGAMTDYDAPGYQPWKDVTSSAYAVNEYIREVYFDSRITHIGAYAAFAAPITSITLSGNVTSIGYSAFESCKNLSSVSIPSSVTRIEGCAFSNCPSLTSVTLPSNLTALGNGAFSSCTSLRTINIPQGITSIEDATFAGCTSLVLSEIPNNITKIGQSGFYNCKSLTLSGKTLPSNLRSIGNYAFENCTNLALTGDLPATLTDIGYWSVFSGVDSTKTHFDRVLSGATITSGMCIPTSYTVTDTFNAGKSSITTTKYGFVGDTSVSGTAPTYTNYRLTSDCTNSAIKIGRTYDDRLKLTRVYTLNSYSVSLSANGGKFSDNSTSKTISVGHGYSLSSSGSYAVPTREGYTFSGWLNGSTPVDPNTTSVTGSLSLTAKWSINEYTVTFDEDNGNTPTTQKVTYGNKATKPAGSPTKKGAPTYGDADYLFRFWVLEGTESEYDFNSTVRKDIKLIAKYQTPVKVTVNASGGKFSDGSDEKVFYHTPGSVMTLDSTMYSPVRSGYTFTKWYKDADLTDEYKAETGLTENLKLYAGWDANSYTITYNYNGGSVVSENKTGYKPTDEAFVLNDATKLHYIFLGYTVENDAPDGLSIAVPQGSLTIPKGTYGNLKVTANFTEKQMHTVTFDLGYEGSTPFTVKVYDEEEVELPDAPVREGFFFKGWTDKDGNLVTDFNVPVKGDMGYTAVWKQSYAVTFDADGGTFNDNTSAVTLHTDADGHVSYVPTPERAAREFKGYWKVSADDSTAKYTEENDFSVWNKDVTLHAQYERKVFSIRYNLDGGKTEDSLYSGYDGSVEVSITDNVEKEGYYFIGWTIENDGADGAMYGVDTPTKNIVIPIDTYGNLTVRAKYSKKHDVELNADGGKFENGSDKINLITDADGKVVITEVPKKDGYIFGGWQINGKDFDPDKDVITEDTVLKPKWEANKVTITFISCDKVVESKTYFYGDEISTPAVTRTGHTLTGWGPDFNKTAKSDTVYTASWRVNTYSIRFKDYDGQTLSENTYSYGSAIELPKNPIRTGYIFKGYTPEISSVCVGNAEYTAVYEKEEVKYLITFATYDGKIITSTSYKEGESITVPNAPEVEGYTFRKWYPDLDIKANKSVTYIAVYDAKVVILETVTKPQTNGSNDNSKKEEPEEIKESDNEKPDVIPQKEKYTVVFKDTEGKVLLQSVYSKGDTVSQPEAPEVEGYSFEGWTPTFSNKAEKDTEYKTVYKKNSTVESVGDNTVKNKKKVNPVVKSLVAGAACVGILTAGYFSGVWLLLLNLLFVGRRRKWKGILTEEENKYLKTVEGLDDVNAYIPALFEELSDDINAFIDSVSVLNTYTVLPFRTKMFVTFSDSQGLDTRSFDKPDEELFYSLLAENLSQDTRVILNLVNEKCDMNIEIEFSMDSGHRSGSLAAEPTESMPDEVSDDDLEIQEELQDYSK